MRAHRMEDIIAAIFGKYCLPQVMKMYNVSANWNKKKFRNALFISTPQTLKNGII